MMNGCVLSLWIPFLESNSCLAYCPVLGSTTVTPWNIPASNRFQWAEGLEVPTIKDNPNPDVLWWVGCAHATDVRTQKTARAVVSILESE